jgi:hypothetical protein
MVLSVGLPYTLVAQEREPIQTTGNRVPRFAVTLVLGDVQPGKSGEFSPAALRALEDMKDFLPYKRYTPLDTVYSLGVGTTADELLGPEGKKYSFQMVSQQLTESSLYIKLALVTPPPVKGIVDTNFKIAPGETVVVGTSRLDGGKALILLVTAVK